MVPFVVGSATLQRLQAPSIGCVVRRREEDLPLGGEDTRDLLEGVLRPDQMFGDLYESDTTEQPGLEGKISVQVDHFRIEPPPAHAFHILHGNVDARHVPSQSGSMGGNAAAATTDIEQFPVSERRGKNRECEPVPALVGLESPLGIQAIRWNRRHGIHRSGNLDSVNIMDVFH